MWRDMHRCKTYPDFTLPLRVHRPGNIHLARLEDRLGVGVVDAETVTMPCGIP